MNLTFCNTTAEDQTISEIPLWEDGLTFHHLAVYISGGSAILAMVFSFYLIWMHALHYTQPQEQRNIIRILLMVPIYAASNFLQLKFYHHAVYYSVISDCYEAFAISSFFALMCQYIAPDLHKQKQFFRQLQPITPWVMPLNWFKACCGGDRGPWRTPKSGLTWFNIIWIGIYHYCFIRVSMTIVAVVTQHFKRYCESSDSPYFAHIWCLVINSIAVTIAMYCVIQFYVQLKTELADHKPFLKVVSIKGVIFLSFWQSTAISLATSEFNVLSASSKLQYPDISTGIPSLLLCFEMFLFSILHIFAYPWKPYRQDAPTLYYPAPNANAAGFGENVHITPSGGPMGFKAIMHALNLWDVIKAFGRGMRWLFVGVKHRHEDDSYQKNTGVGIHMDGKDDEASYAMYPYRPRTGVKSTEHLPVAHQFRRSTFGINPNPNGRVPVTPVPEASEEGAGLIANAQDNPSSRAPSPYHEYGYYREDQPYESDLGYRGAAQQLQQGQVPYNPPSARYQDEQPLRQPHPIHPQQEEQMHALSRDDYYESPSPRRGDTTPPIYAAGSYQQHEEAEGLQDSARGPRNSTQVKVGQALWGHNPHQHPDGPMI